MSGHFVTWGAGAVAGMDAACSEPSLWTVLITVLPVMTRRTLPLALSSHMVTRHPGWTGTLLLTAGAKRSWFTLFLAGVSPVTRFTDAGAMATVTLQSVLLDTVTFLRAARSKRPLWTREVAEASVQSRVAQTGSVGSVASSVICTVTLLVALFAVEALWTTILTQVSTDSWRTAAAPGDRITAGAVFTLTVERAVFTKVSLGASLVADDARPSIRAVTAVLPHAAFPSVGAVVTRQAAVVPEGVVQTHKLLCQVTLGPQLPLVVFIVVVALQRLAVVLQQRELGADEWQLDGAPAGEGLNCIVKWDAGLPVVVQTETPAAEALERACAVLARVIAAGIVSQTLIYVITAAAVGVEPVSCRAVALVSSGVVGAVLLAAGALLSTLVHVEAGFEVVIQSVTMVTGADGPTG